MKKLKYMFWFILTVLLGVLVYQNQAFFATPHSLRIDLWFYKDSTPPLATGAIIAIFVGFSILLMMMFYFASRFEGYRAKKTIKALKSNIEEDADTISKLNQEVEMLKGGGELLAAPDDVEHESEFKDGDTGDIKTESTHTTQA